MLPGATVTTTITAVGTRIRCRGCHDEPFKQVPLREAMPTLPPPKKRRKTSDILCGLRNTSAISVGLLHDRTKCLSTF